MYDNEETLDEGEGSDPTAMLPCIAAKFPCIAAKLPCIAAMLPCLVIRGRTVAEALSSSGAGIIGLDVAESGVRSWESRIGNCDSDVEVKRAGRLWQIRLA